MCEQDRLSTSESKTDEKPFPHRRRGSLWSQAWPLGTLPRGVEWRPGRFPLSRVLLLGERMGGPLVTVPASSGFPMAWSQGRAPGSPGAAGATCSPSPCGGLCGSLSGGAFGASAVGRGLRPHDSPLPRPHPSTLEPWVLPGLSDVCRASRPHEAFSQAL